MVIRFHCPSCSQPIEVDGEWALKAVSCPYCRKTVTAPVESQIGDVGRIPTAAPAGKTGMPEASGGTSLLPDPQFDATPVVGGVQHNGAAMAAFILACALSACILSSLIVYRSHGAELLDVQQRTDELIQQGNNAMASAQQAWLDYYDGELPGWLMATSLLMMLAFALWVGTLVCAIIGVRRPYRRRYAVFAFGIVALSPCFMCGGMVVGLGL